MKIGFLFWLIMVLWIVFGAFSWRSGSTWPYTWHANGLMIFILFFLLGWENFGFILSR